MTRIAALSALAAMLGVAPAAAALDEALYAKLLQQHTREVDDLAGTRVDYAALARSPEWKRLVASLAESDPQSLASPREKLAFWVNAYNILAIDLVATHWPVASIRDIGSLFSPVWKREAGRIGGEAYTLDRIEHEIIRPLGDPRGHAVVICASTSCPALPREPLAAERLDTQLDAAARRWLADPGKGLRIDRAAARVRLSKIFDWFEADFAPAGGALAFAARYAPADARAWLAENADRARIAYLAYDWRVNALE